MSRYRKSWTQALHEVYHKEVEIDEAPKGTPKPKVEKGRGGYQVMVWSPSSKKYIPQGQPHKNEKDAEKDAQSFEEVKVEKTISKLFSHVRKLMSK